MLIRNHPVIAALNALVLAFAVLELIELWSGVGLHLLLPEALLQVVLVSLQILAVWHAVRHL